MVIRLISKPILKGLVTHRIRLDIFHGFEYSHCKYLATCAVKFKPCRLKTCIHRRDAKIEEINDFFFAVERTAKRDHSI